MPPPHLQIYLRPRVIMTFDLGSKQASRGAPTRITWSRSVRWCLAVGLACGDQRRLTENGSALEVLHDDTLYKSTTLLFFTFISKSIFGLVWLWPLTSWSSKLTILCPWTTCANDVNVHSLVFKISSRVQKFSNRWTTRRTHKQTMGGAGWEHYASHNNVQHLTLFRCNENKGSK